MSKLITVLGLLIIAIASIGIPSLFVSADPDAPACHVEAGATCFQFWAEGFGEDGQVTFYAVDRNGLQIQELPAYAGQVIRGAWILEGDTMVYWDGARGKTLILKCDVPAPAPTPTPTPALPPEPCPVCPAPTPAPTPIYAYKVYLPNTVISIGWWTGFPTGAQED